MEKTSSNDLFHDLVMEVIFKNQKWSFSKEMIKLLMYGMITAVEGDAQRGPEAVSVILDMLDRSSPEAANIIFTALSSSNAMLAHFDPDDVRRYLGKALKLKAGYKKYEVLKILSACKLSDDLVLWVIGLRNLQDKYLFEWALSYLESNPQMKDYFRLLTQLV